METMQRRTYEMFVRVRDFGDTHTELFAGDAVGRKQLAIIAEAVTELGTHASAKMTTARDGTTVKEKARDTLVKSLEAVARTARAIALDTPGLEDKFVIGGRSDQELITAGRTFAQEAEAFAAQFIAHRMPKTFTRDLVTVVDAFEQAIRDRQMKVDQHLAARTRIETTLSTAMAAVHKLDAIVANALHDDSVTMAVWTRDRRVGYVRKSRKAQPKVDSTPAEEPAATSTGTKEAA